MIPRRSQGLREAKTESFVNNRNIMSEKTGLPDLDYKALAVARLGVIAAGKTAEGKVPAGRFDTLLAYLRSRGSQVDAAEADRRLRTWFEDVVDRVLSDPEGWDQDMTLNGKSLFDFLSGVKSEAAPAPQEATK